MTKNLILHVRTKHIEVHHNFIRDKVQSKEIELLHCTSDEQGADIFTKPLGKDKFQFFINKLRIK